jgi:hypothetical protein
METLVSCTTKPPINYPISSNTTIRGKCRSKMPSELHARDGKSNKVKPSVLARVEAARQSTVVVQAPS